MDLCFLVESWLATTPLPSLAVMYLRLFLDLLRIVENEGSMLQRDGLMFGFAIVGIDIMDCRDMLIVATKAMTSRRCM